MRAAGSVRDHLRGLVPEFQHLFRLIEHDIAHRHNLAGGNCVDDLDVLGQPDWQGIEVDAARASARILARHHAQELADIADRRAPQPDDAARLGVLHLDREHLIRVCQHHLESIRQWIRRSPELDDSVQRLLRGGPLTMAERQRLMASGLTRQTQTGIKLRYPLYEDYLRGL